MAEPLSPPRLLPSGDSAITVEFSRTIDDAANQRVLTLDRALAAAKVQGVTETVPTYRSLLVHYDPVRIGFDALGAKLLTLAKRERCAASQACHGLRACWSGCMGQASANSSPYFL